MQFTGLFMEVSIGFEITGFNAHLTNMKTKVKLCFSTSALAGNAS